jgi:predicted nucleic acid-binding Zn finger protein
MLSKCIALAHTVLEQLSNANKEFIKSKFEVCSGSTRNKYVYVDFCTHAYFARSLKLLTVSDEELVKKLKAELESWLLDYITFEYMWLPNTTLNMTSYGILSQITKSVNLSLKMKLLDKLLNEFNGENDSIGVKRIEKVIWIMVETAIILNGLTEIQFVGQESIVIPRKHLEDIEQSLHRVTLVVRGVELIVAGILAALSFLLTRSLNLLFPHLPIPVLLSVSLAFFFLTLILMHQFMEREVRFLEYFKQLLDRYLRG